VYFITKEILKKKKKENLLLSKRANARYENLCVDQKMFDGHIIKRKSNGFSCNLKKSLCKEATSHCLKLQTLRLYDLIL